MTLFCFGLLLQVLILIYFLICIFRQCSCKSRSEGEHMHFSDVVSLCYLETIQLQNTDDLHRLSYVLIFLLFILDFFFFNLKRKRYVMQRFSGLQTINLNLIF